MTTTYFPYDSGPGANVTEQQWWKMAKFWRATGVIPYTTPMDKTSNDLAVTAGTALSVNVQKGTAWVKGHYFNSDATITKTLSPADQSNPRIDRIVLRNDWVANTITVEVLQGSPAPSPSPPTLNQTEGTRWEMPLAQVYVAAGATSINSSNITDEREPAVAGGFTIAAKVFRSSTFNVNNATETAVLFDTAIYDNCNMWNGGYKLTAPRTGYYLMTMTISWSGTASAGTRYQRFRKNGTTYLGESQWQPAASATNTASTSTVAKLNKGDYIEAIVYQSSGGSLSALSLSEVYPIMTLTYLGE